MNEMKVDHEIWGNIPLLHIYNEQSATKEAPTVIFLHGFTSAKEHNLHYAYQLVNKGLRVLLPDALLHGEREEELDEVQLSLRFWEIVLTSIEEVQFLRNQLLEKGLAKEGEIGLSGTSMGGIVTLGALKVYPWIKTAAVMMGSPAYVELAKEQIAGIEEKGFKIPLNDEELEGMYKTLSRFDLSKEPEGLLGRPVFFWHGKKDQMVPFKPTHEFYKLLQKDYYQNHPEDLAFMVDSSSGHKVSRAGMLAGTAFLADHLA